MTPEKERKLRQLAQALEGGPVGVLNVLAQIEQELKAEIDDLKAQIPALRQAKDGEPGTPGSDGYTPVKGVDYFDGKDGRTPIHISKTEPAKPQVGDIWYQP